MALYAANEERNIIGVTFAMYACAKMDATLPTIINKIKLLINFLFSETSLDIPPKGFMSIVTLI